jgi:hemerythrin-like domain-containing protein
MMPIGPLMIEHRLIERMILLLDQKVRLAAQARVIEPQFIADAVDFITTYADKLHHGKEEDILFRDLSKKPMSAEHRRIMEELVRDHVYSRLTTGRLADARQRYASGDPHAIEDIVGSALELVRLYPAHIAREDKEFFIPVMSYFSEAEKDAMLQESDEFDRRFVDRKYRSLVEGLEKTVAA